MRTSLSVKTLFRSPLKTIITFILLFASSFMLVYNVLDYALTDREFERSMERYHGVVSVERGAVYQDQEQMWPFFLLSDPTNPANYNNRYPYEDYHMSKLDESDIQAVKDIPQISTASPRYMTAGISPDFMRTDVQKGEGAVDVFFDYTGRFVIEATIDKITPIPASTMYQPVFYMSVYMLTVSDIEPLAGNEEGIYKLRQNLTEEGKQYILVCIPNENYHEEPDFRDRISIFAYSLRNLTYYSNNHFTQEMLDSIVLGERYVMVGRADARESVGGDNWDYLPEDYGHVESYAFNTSLVLGDDTIYGWWDYITPVSDLPENYLESEECEPLRELIKITNDDLHTFDVVYSNDMSTIRRITENRMLLTDGRWLTPKDTANNSPVCVVSDTMLYELGLDIGDKFSLKLGDKLFEQYAPLGAVASTQGRYAENFTEEIEFEIVGAYADMGISKFRNDELYWAYNENTVFVPLSYLPVSEDKLEGHEFKPGELSFVIENAADIRAFVEEELPKLKELGLAVYFSDNNWLNIEQHFNRSKLLTVSKLTAFAAAAALATLLTVYLFVWRKKKEFAIMRALGTTKGKARRSVYIPLFVLAAVAMLLGGIMASIYAGKNAVNILSDFIKLGLEVDTSIPVSSVILGVGSEYLLLVAVTLIALIAIGRKPPLVLLQEGGTRTKRKKAKVSNEITQTVKFTALPKLEPLKTGGYSAVRHSLSYISKSSRRNAGKSVLAIALAAVLFAAMGQFTVLRQAYNELYQNIEIKPRFINGMPLSKAMAVAESGYVHDPYYEYYFDGEANRKKSLERIPCDIVVGNNFERTFSADIEYAEGYDKETIGEVKDRVCVVSDAILNELGLSMGDTIGLNQWMFIEMAMVYDSDITEEIATEMYMTRMYNCTIVGRVKSEKKAIGLPAAARYYFQTLIKSVNLDLAEYTLNDYHQAVEFTVYARDAADVRTGATRPIFIMDTSEADNIYMIYRLIETLYPIALIAAVILGGGLPGLIILQNAREASILRVLGTTKKRTRLMLLLEQLFLCVVGLIIALAVLGLINGPELAAVAVPIGIYCALHFIGCVVGTTAASITVTKKKVLELLQTKE